MNDNLIRHPFFALLYGFSPAPRSLSLVDQLISLPAELIINLSHTFTILFFFLTCFCFFLYNCPSRLALPCVPRLHCSHAPTHTYTHHTPHTHTRTHTHIHTHARAKLLSPPVQRTRLQHPLPKRPAASAVHRSRRLPLLRVARIRAPAFQPAHVARIRCALDTPYLVSEPSVHLFAPLLRCAVLGPTGRLYHDSTSPGPFLAPLRAM